MVCQKNRNLVGVTFARLCDYITVDFDLVAVLNRDIVGHR
jgi:hypothetical protein